jgi:hypothetical protein
MSASAVQMNTQVIEIAASARALADGADDRLRTLL